MLSTHWFNQPNSYEHWKQITGAECANLFGPGNLFSCIAQFLYTLYKQEHRDSRDGLLFPVNLHFKSMHSIAEFDTLDCVKGIT